MWPLLLPAGLAGFVIYDVQAGLSFPSIAWLILGDTLEILVAAYGVSYFLSDTPRLDSLKALAEYSFFTVFLASLIVSSIGIHGLNGDFWLSWRFSFLSEALAFLTVTPAIIGVFGQRRTLRSPPYYYLEAVLLIATLSSVGYYIFVAPARSDQPALLYALVPFLIWSALRFGSAGVGISTTAVALISIWGAVHGRGPFNEADPIKDVLSLQVFLLFTSIPFMVLAVLVEERKWAQDGLRKSEERLRSSMESGKAVGWEWDLKTGRDSWFGDLRTMFGIPSESLVGRLEDFYRYVHPQDRQQVSSAVADAREKHQPYSAEFRILWPNGTMRWATAMGEFQYSSKGEPERMLGMAVDITDRKKLERELHESEDRLKSIVASAMDAIIAVDESQRILLFNASAEKMFGCLAEDVIGEPIDRFIPERFRGRHSTHIRQFGEARITSRAMGTLNAPWALRSNGQEFPVEASISHVEDGGKTLFTVIIRDVTDRRRAERDRRESEERFRLVANTAPVLIWMSDIHKSCTYFNDFWLAFTGRSMAEELGNGWSEGVHSEDLQRCLDTYNRAFDAREKFKMEYRLRRHDGEHRWVLDIGVPRFNQDGSFAGFIGSCVDVTDRKLAEVALSGVNRRLIDAQERERSRIARELHDDISQRLAMLTITLGQIGQEFSDLPADLVRRIGELRSQSSDLALDVQSLSHELHSSKLEYLGIITAMKAFCREFSNQQNVDVVFSYDEVPRTLSQQIALCLFRVSQEALQNAVKHSGVRHFDVELRYASDEICLTVRDSGSGFDSEGVLKTAGLGLVSMAERVELVGGRFSIKSQPNHGTVIYARVPLSEVATGVRAGTQPAFT